MKIASLAVVVGATDDGKLVVETIEGTKALPLTVLDERTIAKMQPKLDSMKRELEQTIETKLGSVYRYKGSVAFDVLASNLGGGSIGDTYNINEQFTTDESFVEGPGHTYPAGTNVALVYEGANMWDVLAGTVDVSSFATKAELDSAKAQADAALKLVNARTIRTNLASATAVEFNGTADIEPGVTGILGAANGGTGKGTLKDAGVALTTALAAGSGAPSIDSTHYMVYTDGTTADRRPLSDFWTALEAKVKATKVNAAASADSATAHGSSLIPTGTDINTYKGSSYWGKNYYAQGGHGCKNIPGGIAAFGLSVHRSASGYTDQALYTNDGALWFRAGNDASSFGSWVKVYTTGTLSSLITDLLNNASFINGVKDKINLNKYLEVNY